MTVFALFVVAQLTLLSSVHGVDWKTTGQLRTCQYPSICQDNCEEGFEHRRCPDPSRDCPCIIQACWTHNDSCVHACNETTLMTCLDCVNSTPDNECATECTGVCLDAKCEHSRGECPRCVPGVYGKSCSQSCSSVCEGSCHRVTGYCKLCPPRRHGLECEQTCPNLCHTCSLEDGSCLRCERGYTGAHCNTPCTDGLFGFDCDQKCSTNCARTCHRISGSCIGGCKPGYFRADCMKACPPGRYGQGCASECAVTCAVSAVCHHVNGSCTNGCSPGFRGQQCGVLCSLGTYGPNCSKNCSQHCFFGVCNRFSGHCQRCDVGRAGLFCEHVTQDRDTTVSMGDDDMSTDQTIILFLGLFAMGGAMWFLLGTFVYYKQKIITKKMQQTGKLPDNWTSLVRRYPQYFYNPKFMGQSKSLQGASGGASRAPAVQGRGHTQRQNQGYTFNRRMRQGLLNNVQMEAQRKSVRMERIRDNSQKWLRNINGKGKNLPGASRNVEEEVQGKNLKMGEQTRPNRVFSIEHSPVSSKDMGQEKSNSLVQRNRKISHGHSPDSPPERRLHVDSKERSAARTEMSVPVRGQDREKLTTPFELEELRHQSDVEEPGKLVTALAPGSKLGRPMSSAELHGRAKSGTPLESAQDGAGDTKSSTLVDVTLSTATAGLETGFLPTHSPGRSPSVTKGQGMSGQLPYKGICLQPESHSKRRSPKQERKSVVGEPGTSTTSVVCPVCGMQSVYSMECQCSAVTTVRTQPALVAPVLLGRAKSSSLHENVGKGNLQVVAEHGLSHTSSSYSNMKLAAAHARDSRKSKDVFKLQRASIRTKPSRDERVSRSRHTLASSIETPRVEVSTVGDSEGESVESGTLTSGSSTLHTSKIKTEASSGSGTEGELSQSMSTTIASSAMTETSDEGSTSARSSLSERQHRFFQAALERQSQHYLAKVDMWPRVDEENPGPGVPDSRNDDKNNKPPGLFQRSLRNMVGTFSKLLGGVPQTPEAASTSSPAKTTQNEAVSSQVLIHRLESWRQHQEAATGSHDQVSGPHAKVTGPHAKITGVKNKRHRRGSSRAEKVSLAETLTERSSVVTNRQRTSSRTGRADSTLTDASDYSTGSPSPTESGSTTLRSSEVSSSAASSTSDTSEESTEKHTSTDADSLPATTRSSRHNKSRHARSHRSRKS